VTGRVEHLSSRTDRRLGLLSVALAGLLAFLYSLRHMSDSDLGHHLRVGEHFLETGSILRTFAFNAGPAADRPFLNHEWLFQALVAGIERRGGEAGLMVLQTALVLTAFGILFLTLRLVSSNLALIGLVLGLGVAASSQRLSLRPQHLTYVFLALLLAILHLYQRGNRRWVWALPPIMLVWVNVHAECLWGLLIPAGFLVVEGCKGWKSGSLRPLAPLTGALGLSALASLVNPFGFKTVIWPLIVMGEMGGRVEELLRPTTSRFLFFWVYCALAAIAVGLSLFRKPQGLDPTWGLLSLVFLGVAWTANRGIPHFVFVSAPLVVAGLDSWWQEARISPLLRKVLLVLPPSAMGILALLIVRDPRYLLPHDGVPYPEGAIRFVKEQRLSGGIFNEHIWGGFLLWEGRPGLRPMIDGRAYLKSDFDEMEALRAARPGWQRLFRERAIGMALLSYPAGAPPWLADALFADPNWALVHWDDVSRLYVERTLHPEAFARFGNRLVEPDRQLLDQHEGKGPLQIASIRQLTERMAELEPRSYRARILAGNAAFASRDSAKALGHYEAALPLLDPPNAWIHYQIASCALLLGDRSRAADHLRATLRLAPEFQEARQKLEGLQNPKKDSPVPSTR
jgi:hypothetical protein